MNDMENIVNREGKAQGTKYIPHSHHATQVVHLPWTSQTNDHYADTAAYRIRVPEGICGAVN